MTLVGKTGLRGNLCKRHIPHHQRGRRTDSAVAEILSDGVRVMLDDHKIPSVLIVDNDPVLGQMMVKYLSHSNISAAHVAARKEALEIYDELDPDLMILDLQLRHDDGLDALRDFRQRTDIPIIIAAGPGLDEIDRVVALELGADDYIAKPFGMRELLARIRAQLRRRSSDLMQTRRKSERGTWRFGGWELRLRPRELRNPSGVPVQLTKGEYALLIAFLEAAERPLTREYLLQTTRVHEDIFDRSIDVQILRLRRKLEDDPSTPRMIKTERGVGYVFVLPVDRE